MGTATETIPRPGARSLVGARLREAGWGYAFVIVPMAVFGIFFIYPFVYAIYISFFDWGILGKVASVGTQNYHDALRRPGLPHGRSRTPSSTPSSSCRSRWRSACRWRWSSTRRSAGRAFFRSAFYFPSIASSVAITTIAIYILNAERPPQPRSSAVTAAGSGPSTALWSIVGLNAWTTAGTVMLFYLAALQAIPTDVYEAAAVDRASAWRTFWRITFPLLKPAHFFVLVVFGIGALKIFDQAFIVSGGTGGPQNSTYTTVLYIYLKAFHSSDFGIAAAAGVVLFVIIFGLT